MYKIQDFNREQATQIEVTLENYKNRYLGFYNAHNLALATLMKSRLKNILDNTVEEQKSDWMKKNYKFLQQVGILS